MTVSCPECRSVFRVDPAKVPATGVRARCSVCGGVIAISGGTLPVSVTPVGASAAIPAFAGGVSRATPVSGVRAPATPSRPTPAGSTRAPFPVPPAGAAPAATPVATPVSAPGSTPAPARPPAPTPAVQRPPTPANSPAAPVLAAVTPMAAAAVRTPPGGVPVGGARVPTPPGARPSINPFLRADPAQRARRLARALVSDLVAYHPQKREEGLRDGTLRQLFREEIKKSYEEYVEQVGKEVAESAPHFQDALNDILAGGRRLF